jgi:hypothetical protein
MKTAWLEIAPYQWQAFDNEQYGIYIVAREPERELKIRVLGQAPNYSLEINFDVEPQLIEQAKSEIFKIVFGGLLPAVGATDIRDTSWETTG